MCFLVAAFNIPAQNTPPLAAIKAAAEAGDPNAQDKLGDAYRSCQDTENAEIWYRKAAEKGIANSQCALAQILMRRSQYPLSKLNPKERADVAQEAIRWHIKAANQGNKRAQVDLGREYQSGKHVTSDLPEAYKWFSLAAAGNNPFDPVQLEGKRALDALVLKMTQDQIAEGQKRVAAFTPRKLTDLELLDTSHPQALRLSGISGPPDQRLAIINGKTFAPGEQGDVKAGTQTFRIKLQEIKERSVIISFSDETATRELHLPD
jgi:hypothetical protein